MVPNLRRRGGLGQGDGVKLHRRGILAPPVPATVQGRSPGVHGVGAGAQGFLRLHIAGPHNGNVQKDGQIVIGRIQSQGHLVPLRGDFRHMAQAVAVHRAALCRLQTGRHILGRQRRAVGKGGLRQLEAVGLSVGGAAVALAQHRLRPVLGGHRKQALVHQGDERPVGQPGAGVGVAAGLRLIGQAEALGPVLPRGLRGRLPLPGGSRLRRLRPWGAARQEAQAQGNGEDSNGPWHHNPSCGS